MSLPRERRGGRRSASRPTPTTWSEDVYVLWRDGHTAAEISQLLNERHDLLVAPHDVERLALEVAAQRLRETLGRRA